MSEPDKVVHGDFATLEEYTIGNYLVEIYTLDEFKTVKATPKNDIFLQPFIIFQDNDGIIDCGHIAITIDNVDQVIKNLKEAASVIKEIQKIVAEEES